MQRFVWGVFAAAVMVALAVIAATVDQLPARVATHFGAGGNADRWMAHDTYAILIVAIAVAGPLAVAAATAWLPRVAPAVLKLDRCARWSNPAARPAVLAATATYGAIVGTLLAVFVAALHWLVVDANGRVPPQLDEVRFITFLATSAVVIVVATVLHAIHLRRA